MADVVLPPMAPDAPYVEFVSAECRKCGERSSWGTEDDMYKWQFAHNELRGHRSFYGYRLSRFEVKVW